jgi:hypothetical protein
MRRFGAWPLVSLLVTLGATNLQAQSVQPCPDAQSCAQFTVGSVSGSVGGIVSVPVTFRQGPPNAQAGGIDEIAALAFSLSIGPNLTLADCNLNSEGLPGAVRPNAAISNFRVVVENASCAGGRTHCLCPEGAGPRDPFVNIVVYGPNPLPTPGPNPVEIPILPQGPQELFSIDLRIGTGASGDIPLHVYTETVDSEKPQFTAYLSVGDRLAVDQTCVPVSGQPPCSSAGAVSQVAITQGNLRVSGASCVGDCNADGEVTVDELLRMVNIALGNAPVGDCNAGDANRDGEITIDEILQGVNNALNGCS